MTHASRWTRALPAALLVAAAPSLCALRAQAPTESPNQPDAASPQPADDELISLAFKNMSIEDLAKFISEKTGKPVIPHESVKSKRITIVSTEKMTLPAAMQTLREALHLSGVIMEEHELLISLRPIEDAPRTNLPILGVDDPLAEVEDRSMIARKVFHIEHYDPNKIKDAIVPMLPDYGSVVADSNTRKLVVTDTISGLARIEQVIDTLDVPSAADTVRKIIELEHADASWVASIIKLTISGDASLAAPQVAGGGGPSNGRGGPRGRPSRGGDDNAPSGEGVVAIHSEQGPVLLVPEVTRNWLIAVAPAAVMQRIQAWVEKLDKPGNTVDAYQMYDVEYVNVIRIAEQLTQAIEAMPTLRGSAGVVPFPASGKLLVFSPARGQRMVEDLLTRLDVEGAVDRTMRVFPLEYADAEAVATNIEALFAPQTYVSETSRWGRTEYDVVEGSGTPAKAIPDTRRNTVTVVADSDTMEAIERMIREQWDLPLDADEVQPKVYRLEHADPVQVQDLLTSLFSERQQSFSAFDYFYGGGGTQQASPVGRLFGQFSFQALPDSNQLVVTTTNVANYQVIDELIEDLDQPQDAGIPQIIELKHAYAEDLAEQINAALAEAGTLAQIQRSTRELSARDQSSGIAEAINNSQSGGGRAPQQARQPEQADPNAMRFWWQQAQPDPNEQPTSNLIGEVRVVPVVRRNALMILAPQAYREPIAQMIAELDHPGSQVIIRAVIAEVQHDNATTLGIRIASDPAALSDPDLADQSIGGSATTSLNQLLAEPFQLGDDSVARGIFSADLNLNVLLQLLIREFGLQILTEPKLYTSDNEEAEFFDGRDVSIQTLAQTTDEGTLNRSFTYVPIGTQLRVRPHITQEGDVSLRINLVLSSISPGETTFGNPIFNRREVNTHVIVHDGQTVMLSGIVSQEDFRDVRKLPLLGDLPLVGGLFRSTDKGTRNRELIVFITPEVVPNTPLATEEAMEPYREKLEELRGRLPGRETPE